MKDFKDYFTDEDIIFYLCRLRAKVAKQRNKKHLIHMLTGDAKFNYHTVAEDKVSEYEKQFQEDLNKILPKRRQWKDLGEKSRYNSHSKQKLSSIDKNIFSLVKTIHHYRKHSHEEGFVQNLNAFIADIQSSISCARYTIATPTIYPKPKDKKRESELKENETNICRPISLFSLKDRLILSFTNKYLTQLFDKYFENCSLAFRTVRIVDGRKEIVTHHTAIREIIKYKELNKDSALWVAECDMKKFYDSVNHEIILKCFQSLVDKAINDNPGIDISMAEAIFLKYLQCYCFNKDVLKYKGDKIYWSYHKIAKGEFEWIKKDLDELNYYNDIDEERIGVPQGGALSGLIANIVLDCADKKVINNPDLLYVRFCDDMILMHPDESSCNRIIKEYKASLNELKLVPHSFSNELKCDREIITPKLPPVTLAPFWKEKSKGPYKWDEVKSGGFPWIGFVGYELNHKGFLRVRKSSIEKEHKKQHEVIKQILIAIKNEKRVGNGTVSESAVHRLIGMSVGRVELWNFSEIENEMCWKNGFQELNWNKYVIKQLKQLDKLRSKLYYKLVKDLEELTEETDNEKSKKLKSKSRQIIGYNKPFSYYYQVAERAKL